MRKAEIKTKTGKLVINIRKSPGEIRTGLTDRDREMDKRATRAVKAAVEKAKVCRKPVAGYDIERKKAYIEYADGKRQYVE
ncbi:MAG TPA: hypothetical protein H9782_09510 [Candidatus Bariatricus faecipullorum]|nr:hypothetical protein [Candidatus Bariatricus faecipullorum]